MTDASAPVPNPETAAYFEGLQAGRLMLKRCKACGEAHFYPRSRCPFCFGETDWEAASGAGTVYSYSVTRPRGGGMLVLAYVTLAEGPTMMTNIVDADPARLAVDAPVRLRVAPDPRGRPAPMFVLA